MSKKRFTDIEIWDREWYMELKPVHKCLMKYIFDKCDASGCWKPNWKLASLHIGEKVTHEDLSELPNDQYEILENDKIFIPDFIKFQYGRLSRECKPHLQIIQLIDKNDLTDRFEDFIDERGISVKALRKRFTEKAKKEIFEQDDYQCQYCGSRPGSKLLFVDHIIPLVKGGDNSDGNLCTACKSCNSKKYTIDVFEFLSKNGFKPLNNLSKKLDTLYKKKNTLMEEEEEKEEDKEKEKDVGKVFKNEGIAPEMYKIFKDNNVKYPHDKTKDFSACLSMAYKIAESKGWERDDVLLKKKNEVLESWKKIVIFCSADKWFSTRALFDLNNEWQRVIQSMNGKFTESLKDKQVFSSIKKESEVDFDKYKKVKKVV